jgi:predicted DNA-binding antitoxin AbrB/MazE fold protein
MISVMAVYENGVLKPHEPLELTEGQTVQLAIYPRLLLKPLRPRTPEEEDFDRRLKAAKTLEEAFAVMDTAPQSAEDFDIIKAMNETRRLTGFRMPDPVPEEGAGP